jgi:hypothetical protein
MTSQPAGYHGYRFPPEIIGHAVWFCHRFCLGFRNAEDLLARCLRQPPIIGVGFAKGLRC